MDCVGFAAAFASVVKPAGGSHMTFNDHSRPPPYTARSALSNRDRQLCLQARTHPYTIYVFLNLAGDPTKKVHQVPELAS